MKKYLVILMLLWTSFCFASVPEYKPARYIDLDGDWEDEIIIETWHGAGTGYIIETMRIFKEDEHYENLNLIFMTNTLEVNAISPEINYDDISTVEFTGPFAGSNAKDIIVRTKKVYYKDLDEREEIEKEEDLGAKTYIWNGKRFEIMAQENKY